MNRLMPDAPQLPTGPWKCFHCGETFTDYFCARDHFGYTEDSSPACRLKGPELSILKLFRQAEEAAQVAWQALHSETTDVHQAMYAMKSRHEQAVRAAEELGYSRGMEDCRKELSSAFGIINVAQYGMTSASNREAAEAWLERNRTDG